MHGLHARHGGLRLAATNKLPAISDRRRNTGTALACRVERELQPQALDIDVDGKTIVRADVVSDGSGTPYRVRVRPPGFHRVAGLERCITGTCSPTVLRLAEHRSGESEITDLYPTERTNMANAPTQPSNPGLDPSTPAQGDMPGAYNPANQSRPIQSPPSHVKGVAIAIGIAVVALSLIAIVTRDDTPNPPVNPEGDIPVEPAR